jgi:hypothetical protein
LGSIAGKLHENWNKVEIGDGCRERRATVKEGKLY